MNQFARVTVRFAIVAAALLAAACTQTVRSEVSRFHTMGITPNQHTDAIEPSG